MQSLAQKKARENFKKAIEYRKKTGCSLKQAFAHIKSKSTVIKKKAATKKVAVKKITKKKVGVIKKKAAKKPSEKSILNKIHKVKHEVERLDEAQHKHMIGVIQKDALRRIADLNSTIIMRERQYKRLVSNKKRWIEDYGLASYQNNLKSTRNIIAELKKHKTELKKHI